jgi:RimJ/RimL family protein N-acetyltransferase
MTSLPWQPTLPIVTERLALRVHEPADVDDLLQYHSDPEVVRFIPWPERTREQVVVAIEQRMQQGTVTKEGDWLVLAMELRDTGQVIGEVLMKCASVAESHGELGYAMHRGFHGKGLAFEATSALMQLAIAELGLRRVTAELDHRNAASAKLLERLGFTLLRSFEEEYKDESTTALEYEYLIKPAE